MAPNFYEKKVIRKQKRCQSSIKQDLNLDPSETPTTVLAILNAGLATGLNEESVLNAIKPHGEIKQVTMARSKSYCFFECLTVADAEKVFDALHNKAKIGQAGTVIYLSFYKQLPFFAVNSWEKPWPKGVILLEDFVTGEEEELILKAIAENSTIGGDLKHRKVRHYGYEFLYGVNNVNSEKPLTQQIPQCCNILWSRLKEKLESAGLQLPWDEPDQLTVNEYEPGQGIPPHVDTHSAFLDCIVSLSLLDGVVMEFRKEDERIDIPLTRRSMLVMINEARYDWTHGIMSRVTDIIPSAAGALTVVKRQKRISLTFRRLRRGPCDCKFPRLCDTKSKESQKQVKSMEDAAVQLEEQNVHNVYDKIAGHFDSTRHTPWPRVVGFLKSFDDGSLVYDVGCGNGKYLNVNPDIRAVGCDRCQQLVESCINKGYEAFRCDCLALPLRSGSADGCISIAVIHHLATEERRLEAIREMARILRSGGRGLIYVWAIDQTFDNQKSKYLQDSKTDMDTENQQNEEANSICVPDAVVNLPVHKNRTNFKQQDVFVPWHRQQLARQKDPIQKQAKEEQSNTFFRYYHVFEKNELENLIEKLPELSIIESYYDQGNHCVKFLRS